MFSCVTPKIGEMIQFDEHIFSNGWSNHLTRYLLAEIAEEPTGMMKNPSGGHISSALVSVRGGEVRSHSLELNMLNRLWLHMYIFWISTRVGLRWSHFDLCIFFKHYNLYNIATLCHIYTVHFVLIPKKIAGTQDLGELKSFTLNNSSSQLRVFRHLIHAMDLPSLKLTGKFCPWKKRWMLGMRLFRPIFRGWTTY